MGFEQVVVAYLLAFPGTTPGQAMTMRFDLCQLLLSTRAGLLAPRPANAGPVERHVRDLPGGKREVSFSGAGMDSLRELVKELNSGR